MKSKSKRSNETNKKAIAYCRVASKQQMDPSKKDDVEKIREIRPYSKIEQVGSQKVKDAT